MIRQEQHKSQRNVSVIFVWFLHTALPLPLLFISLPREPCLRNGTITAPTPPCHSLSHLHSQTPTHAHTHTLVWSLVGEVQPGSVSPPPPFPSFPSFPLFPPPPSLFFPNGERSSLSRLSVTRVISLCYFIWLSNESNPSAFHCSAAQIMRARLTPLLSHTSPLLLTLSLSLPNPAVNGWRKANVCASECVKHAISPNPLCLYFPFFSLGGR